MKTDWNEALRGPEMSATTGRTIYKYQIPVKEEFTLSLPKGAKVLRVEDQDGLFWMWALIDTNADLEERHFCSVKTGGTVPYGPLEYLGFCKIFIQQELGLYIFEKKFKSSSVYYHR